MKKILSKVLRGIGIKKMALEQICRVTVLAMQIM